MSNFNWFLWDVTYILKAVFFLVWIAWTILLIPERGMKASICICFWHFPVKVCGVFSEMKSFSCSVKEVFLVVLEMQITQWPCSFFPFPDFLYPACRNIQCLLHIAYTFVEQTQFKIIQKYNHTSTENQWFLQCSHTDIFFHNNTGKHTQDCTICQDSNSIFSFKMITCITLKLIVFPSKCQGLISEFSKSINCHYFFCQHWTNVAAELNWVQTTYVQTGHMHCKVHTSSLAE